jgi:hypothetical protein
VPNDQDELAGIRDITLCGTGATSRVYRGTEERSGQIPERATPGHLQALAERCSALSFAAQTYLAGIFGPEARGGRMLNVFDRRATKGRDANTRFHDGSQTVRC